MDSENRFHLQSRHDEFIKLEKSITEVRDMFFEVAQLVQEQGEMVRPPSRLIQACVCPHF